MFATLAQAQSVETVMSLSRETLRDLRLWQQARAERWLVDEFHIAVNCGLKVSKVTYRHRPLALIGRNIVGLAYEGDNAQVIGHAGARP
jgi:hypothetical protein